ncbi:MAG: hypothetical protein FWD82_07820 [Defluviitaleaceae bacterium]|nr:hypothetical protein [Defluviitaleaceae bacterium]
MKKFISIIGLCSMVLMLTACSGQYQEVVDDGVLTIEPPNIEVVDVLQNSEATIQIAFATDELLSRFESFHEFVHVEEVEHMIIWTDTHVTDFKFIWLSNSFDLVDWDVDEDTELYFFEEDVIYSVGELTPEVPFKVRTFGDWGMMPRIGISFTDANAITRYFHIQQSMMDGSLNITEFEAIRH